MSLKGKATLVVGDVEGTYGVDATPDGTNAVKTRNLKVMPLEGSTVSREQDRPLFGGDEQIHVGVHQAVEFDVELAGSSGLGVAPPWGFLMRGCQCLETIVAVTSVTYTPDSTGADSLTLYFYLDGQRHLLTGCRGTFSLEVNSQNLPYLKFRFVGLWNDPAGAAAPSPTNWANFIKAIPVSNDNTPIVLLHAQASVLKSFRFEQGNTVTHFDNPGEESVEITDRASTGSISILAPTLATKNWFTAVKDNTLGTQKIQQGTVDAEKVFFECTGNTCQVLQPKYGDDTGRATLDANLSYVPTETGDDEWEIRLAAA